MIPSPEPQYIIMCQVVEKKKKVILLFSEASILAGKKLSWVARVRIKNDFKHQSRELEVDAVLDSEPVGRLDC